MAARTTPRRRPRSSGGMRYNAKPKTIKRKRIRYIDEPPPSRTQEVCHKTIAISSQILDRTSPGWRGRFQDPNQGDETFMSNIFKTRVVERASDPRWEAFAAAEPYFAVLTARKFRRAHLTAADEHDFFESGESFVRDVFRTIDVRFTPDFAPMSILEYGCGVGRLAIPFARRAESITAVDRSTAMLNMARQEA